MKIYVVIWEDRMGFKKMTLCSSNDKVETFRKWAYKNIPGFRFLGVDLKQLDDFYA